MCVYPSWDTCKEVDARLHATEFLLRKWELEQSMHWYKANEM